LDNTEHDPWAAPPDWVHLPDVPGWIERNLNYPGLPLIQSFIAALRASKLKYRIGGLGRALDFIDSNGPNIPAWLVVWNNPRRAVVDDWEKALPNWKSGTVAGFWTTDNKPNRLPIEVWWMDVAKWAPPVARDLASAARKSVAKPEKKQPRRVQGLDYRADDAKLVEEALTGIANGLYRNKTDAARALAKGAVGPGTEESKVKRLIGRIQLVQPRSATE